MMLAVVSAAIVVVGLPVIPAISPQMRVRSRIVSSVANRRIHAR